MITTNRRRCRIAGMLGACACAAIAVMASSVHAAPYSVWACADGSGKRQPAADWQSVRVSNIRSTLNSSCGDSAAEPTARLRAMITSTASNPPAWSAVGWKVDASPGTSITGLDLWWKAQLPITGTRERGLIEISAPHTIYRLEAPPDKGGWFGAWANGPGTEHIAYGEGNHQTYRGLSTRTVTLLAWCVEYCFVAPDVGDGVVGGFEAYRIKTTVEDATAPTGSAPGLLEGTRISRPIAMQASASDVGGGVREISLRVDHHVVDRMGPGGDCADVDVANSDPYEYSRMQPCPSQQSAQLTLSPSAFADGERHVVAVVATDAAGQDTVIGSARVALAAPPGFFANARFFNPDLDVASVRKPNGINAGPASVRLSFVVGRGKHRRFVARRVVGPRTRPLVRGRLTNAHGVPIAGARLWRAVAMTNGSWQISGNPLTTSSTGRVSGRLRARMPNREVRLVYFPYSDSSANVQSPIRRLKVRAATTMHADQAGYRNGDTMRFSGRITTLPFARRKAVYLQVIVRGRWRTFDTTRADPRGRWRLSYRFTATSQLTVYRFRALVPAEEQPVGWATGYSRALRVLVAP